MPVEIPGDALPCQVVIVTVLFAGALADAGDVFVLVDVTGDGDPGFTGGWAVGRCVEPAIFHPGDQAKVNMAELELSGQASSWSINCLHIPSLP